MELVRIIDGKKFMWDGETYDSKMKAEEIAANYKKNGFETQVVEEGKYFVYTRRMITEVVIEGQPL